MTDAPDRLVDEARLAELADDLGGEDLALVLAMFLQEAERETARLAGGLPEAEHLKAGHFLRSGALNLGLIALSDAARHAEVVPTPERAVAVARIAAAVAQTRAALGPRARSAAA